MAQVAPASPFQEQILNSDADILITGGAAGASKSYIGLMRHLRWADDPFYVGYCIRKNSNMLTQEGGLWNEAKNLYRKVYPNISIHETKQKITFPSGATVSFSHYEDDSASEKYHGAQICGCFYDEATQSNEGQIFWLWSRCRTAKAKMKPNMWLSCNPDPDAWLREWVDWWLYPEDHEKAGLPDPDKNGKIRYLYNIGGVKYWGDTREELLEKFGYVEVEDSTTGEINKIDPTISVCVLLGTIYDNPVLMKADPSYLPKLLSMPEVQKQRLLFGNWDAREEGSTYFNRKWLIEQDFPPDKSEIIKTVRAYDFAGTLKSEINRSPDYTACVKFSKLKNGKYFIHDVRRTRILAGEWVHFILENANYDGSDVDIIVPQDPNSAAKFATSLLVSQISEAGFFARVFKTNKSKLDRFRPVTAVAFNGQVEILKGCSFDLENGVEANNNFFYKELEAFTGVRKSGESGHDDMVDALSDAFASVATPQINLDGVLSGIRQFNLGVQKPFYNQ